MTIQRRTKLKSGTTSTLIARNFVAKHAPRCGAGSHMDFKKAQKRGYRKHKGNYEKDTI